MRYTESYETTQKICRKLAEAAQRREAQGTEPATICQWNYLNDLLDQAGETPREQRGAAILQCVNLTDLTRKYGFDIPAQHPSMVPMAQHVYMRTMAWMAMGHPIVSISKKRASLMIDHLKAGHSPTMVWAVLHQAEVECAAHTIPAAEPRQTEPHTMPTWMTGKSE
jgi:hypothetical protein